MEVDLGASPKGEKSSKFFSASMFVGGMVCVQSACNYLPDESFFSGLLDISRSVIPLQG